jgi:hypothetical protein
MDLIKHVFDENRRAFTQKLKAEAYSVDHARGFLPEAASGILDSTENAGIASKISDLLSDDSANAFSSVNVNGIAGKLGISSAQVTSGPGVIAPL